MTSLDTLLLVVAVIATVILFFVGWRWASRVWSLPCPSVVGWALESSFYERITGTTKTLKRIGLKPGQRVLEVGPGPGRLLIPAARKFCPVARQGQRSLWSCPSKHLQQKVVAPAAATPLHGDAVLARMLLQQR